MADDAIIGTRWNDSELDAIVADYFQMLSAELGGLPYVKSHHSQALMVKIGRTHRSVEFNIRTCALAGEGASTGASEAG